MELAKQVPSTSPRYAKQVERSEANLLLGWLLKDLGWVLVFPFVCLPGVVVSSVLMLRVLYISLKGGDTLGTVHTLFELLWLSGNSVWLFSEMFFDSTDAHLPWNYKPLAGPNQGMYAVGCSIAMVFFVIGLASFAAFYLNILIRRCMGVFPWGSEDLVFGCIPVSAYNRSFIGLWIAKDMIWLHERYRAGLVLGIFAFLLIADVIRRARRNPNQNQSEVPLLIVEMLWIGGNIMWMTEEVPLHETHPIIRIMVATVFITGIAMTFPRTSLSIALVDETAVKYDFFETAPLVPKAVKDDNDLVASTP